MANYTMKALLVVTILLLLASLAASVEYLKCAVGAYRTAKMAYDSWNGKDAASWGDWVFTAFNLYYCIPDGEKSG